MSAIFPPGADRVPVVEVSSNPSPASGIEPLSLAEVQEAMFNMRCGRGADGDGLVLEMFKKILPCLRVSLVRIYNVNVNVNPVCPIGQPVSGTGGIL